MVTEIIPNASQLKRGKRYLLFRAYALLAAILWAVTYLFIEPERSLQYIPLLIPFTLAVLPILFNLAAFPFGYSVFGHYQRTPPPNEPVLVKQEKSWGRVSSLKGRGQFFTWSLFPSGLAFSFLGIAEGFIPFEAMQWVEAVVAEGILLHHRSPEIRDPIFLPMGIVAQTLLERFGHRSDLE